jgi:hypothetical protein
VPVLTGVETLTREAMPPPGRCPFIAIFSSPLLQFQNLSAGSPRYPTPNGAVEIFELRLRRRIQGDRIDGRLKAALENFAGPMVHLIERDGGVDDGAGRE